MPEYAFTMDAELLRRCWLAKEISGGHIYHPDFVRSLPLNYLDELAMYGQGVKFFQDLKHRDPAMK